MPARGAQDDESLPVLELDAPELGIRPEDRYAAIPPGPRLIPRRQHAESSAAPLLLLGGLVAFFVVGALLGGAGSDEDDAPDAGSGLLPALEQETGTELLLFGEGTVTALDVDDARLAPMGDIAVGDVLVPSTVPGRVWLTSTEADGSTLVRELDVADGTQTTAPAPIDGRVMGALSGGIVVEREPGVLELVGADGRAVRGLGDQRAFVASAGDVLATKSATCSRRDCEVTIDDLATGVARQVRPDLGTVGAELAAVSPDGRRLAVLRSDGVETHGVLIDLRLETITRFQSRAALQTPTGAPALAWSAEGDWLFVATVRNGLDAVADDGQVYRVEAGLPLFSGVVTG